MSLKEMEVRKIKAKTGSCAENSDNENLQAQNWNNKKNKLN